MSYILPILLAQAGPVGSACVEWCIPPMGPDCAGTPWVRDGFLQTTGAVPRAPGGKTSGSARKGEEGEG